MGFGDRTGRLAGDVVGWGGDVLEGVVGGGGAAVGLVSDLITAPWNTEETFDGASDALWDRMQVRFGELGSTLFAPDTGFGAVFRVAPEPVRQFTGGAVGALETVGREAIREPLSTAFIAANQASHGRGVDVQRAYDLAQSVSAGQALATLAAGKDINDPEEMARFVGTDFFNWTSGTADALLRLFGDVDVGLAKGAKAGRMRYLLRPVNGGLDEAFFTPGLAAGPVDRAARRFTRSTFDDVDDWITSQSGTVAQRAGTIRRVLFTGDDVFADQKALLLARAPDKATRAKVWKFLAGDLGQWKKINEYADELGSAIEDLRKIPQRPRQPTLEWAAARETADEVGEIARAQALLNSQPDEWWRAQGEFNIRNSPEGVDALTAQLVTLQDEFDWASQLSQLFRAQEFEPRLLRRKQFGDQVVKSDWWQSSSTAKPFRLLSELRPHHYVNVEDTTTIDAQLSRMLVDARMPVEQIDELVGRITAEGTSAGRRLQVWMEAEDAALTHIADEFELPNQVVDEIRRRARTGRNVANRHLNDPRSRAFAPDDSALMLWDDEGIATGAQLPRQMPLSRSQTTNMISPPDFRQLRVQMARLEADGLLDGIRDKIRNADGQPVKVTAGELSGSGPRVTFRQYSQVAKEVLESVTYTWKAGVLLRPGWPIRVILMDEHLRMLAKFGASATVGKLPDATRRLGRAYAKELKLHDGYQLAKRKRKGLLATDELADSQVADQIARYGQVRNRTSAAGAALGFLGAGPVGALAGAGAGYGLIRKLASLEDMGYAGLKLGQFDVSSPFDKEGMYRDLVSMNDQVIREFFAPAESGVMQRMKKMKDDWATVTGDADNYGEAWSRAVGRQIAQDPLWRQALEGKTSGEMVEWLESADGLRYLDDIPWRRSEEATFLNAGRWVQQSPEGWVDTLRRLADQLTVGDDTVKKMVLDGDMDGALQRLTRVVGGNRSALPPVHGEVMAQVGGTSPLFEMMDGMIESWMQRLGTMPADNLSRQPTFALFYQREMTRLLDGLTPDDVTPKMLSRLEDAARKKSLSQTRKLLFDLAERTAFGEMVRFVIPFFSAGREVLTRWGGIIADEPVTLAYARKAWEAPEKAGLVWEDDETGEQYLTFRVPEKFAWVLNQGTLFRNAVDSLGQVALPRGAFAPFDIEGGAASVLTGGLFGYGPIVQVGASQLVEKMPQLEDSLKFVLPYGPTDPMRAFMPAWGRRIVDSFGSVDDNRAYRSIYGNILTTRMVSIEQGDVDERQMREWFGDTLPEDAPINFDDPAVQAAFLSSVEQETRALFNLRTFANFTSPVSPMFESPYKPYVDEYRRLQEEIGPLNEMRAQQGMPPTSADALFLQQYGEEFFAVTQGFTKSIDGVPPNLGAFDKRQKFEGLINNLREKELAGLIVGVDGASAQAEFSQAVYQHQLNTEVSPGATEAMREPLAGEEILAGPEVRLGWSKFSRVMDMIEAERISRGLPNLQVKDAQDLEMLRRQAIAAIEQQHPLWAQERQSRDAGRWTNRIGDFRKIAATAEMAGRPEIRGLGQYLKLRDQVLTVLARQREQKKASRLDATANQQLAVAWNTAVAQLRMNNPAFASLYWRWLDSDPVSLQSVGL